MRGKLTFTSTATQTRGLIPAYAGKTIASRASRLSGAAHPRVCGENLRPHFFEVLFEGSSPRMRGKQDIAGGESLARRLIPAYAGKTTAGRQIVGFGRAHPRVCGENIMLSVYGLVV